MNQNHQHNIIIAQRLLSVHVDKKKKQQQLDQATDDLEHLFHSKYEHETHASVKEEQLII